MPLLFSSYHSNLSTGLLELKIISYADDITILVIGKYIRFLKERSYIFWKIET